MRIEEHSLRDLPAELVRELHGVTEVLHREAMPEDPPPPLGRLLGKAQNLPAVIEIDVLLARNGGERACGYSLVSAQDIDGYRHLAQLSLGVLPGARREGVGAALLERSAEAAERRGRTLLMGSSRENVPAGEAFARSFGAELGQVQRENRLDLAAVERGLLRRWLEDGPRRAPGYSLRLVKGQTPPELVPAVIAVWQVMNTAPRDQLDIGELKLTPELLGELERTSLAAGVERWAFYAVEDSTGRFVGLTDVQIAAAQPTHIHIGNTGVEPAHRGHALGKWLKAAITLKVLDDVPQARWLITSNAASNDAMLAINDQMGFRAAAATQTWQLPVEGVRQHLRSR